MNVEGMLQAMQAVLEGLEHLTYSPPVSFGMTPIVQEPHRGRLRPQAARGRRQQVPKAQRYALEFENKVDPVTTGYRVRFYTANDTGKVFDIVRAQQQQDEPVEVVFSCPGSHAYIKSAYLVLGLNEYDISRFLVYVREYPIQPSERLSPDHEGISQYGNEIV
ncbi:hypothetical protein EON65_57250 [archaeon]|nr:MAG: hypothetical protein EON65_57250 [archaeon]